MNINKIAVYSITYVVLFKTIFFNSVLKANHPAIKPWFRQAVILNSYQQSYDWLSPWEKRGIRTQTGMALVVSLANLKKEEIALDKYKQNLNLLTTAEMVANSTLIEVTIKGIRQRFRAKILLLDYAANLALLSVDNNEFWKNLRPIEWHPAKSSIGLETNGVNTIKIKSSDEWIIEKGEIENLSVGYREISDAWFPQIKLKGFSNSGQGFPVIQDNKTVGMILETKSGKSKAIPAEMLLEFFQHVRTNSYVSLGHRGFIWNRLPQRSTADYFKIPYEKPGIWITKVLTYGTGSEVLERGDYLTKIDKWELSHDGKITHSKWGLSLFDLLFLDKLKIGKNIKLHVIRNGIPLVLNTKVSPYDDNNKSVNLEKIGNPPRYIIQGGFLFQELTLNYLYMWGKNWKSRAPIRLRLFLKQNNIVSIHQKKENANSNLLINGKPKPRIVLVTQVIPDQINIGYQKLANAIVLKINGRKIQFLEDVKKAFAKTKSNFHKIDFLPGSNRQSAVLPTIGLHEANQRIKINFRIPKLQSL